MSIIFNIVVYYCPNCQIRFTMLAGSTARRLRKRALRRRFARTQSHQRQRSDMRCKAKSAVFHTGISHPGLFPAFESRPLFDMPRWVLPAAASGTFCKSPPDAGQRVHGSPRAMLRNRHKKAPAHAGAFTIYKTGSTRCRPRSALRCRRSCNAAAGHTCAAHRRSRTPAPSAATPGRGRTGNTSRRSGWSRRSSDRARCRQSDPS